MESAAQTQIDILEARLLADREAIADELLAWRDGLDWTEDADLEEEPALDIRLQVHGSGTWELHAGDPSFDQSHDGFWGASYIVPGMTELEARALAADLIEQVLNEAATT